MTQPPDPNTKLPLSEQLTDFVVKVIKPGGITGGTIGAIWFGFIASDLPKAIASAVIGVALSYGAKLLQPLHEGNQRRLEKTGKVIDQAVDEAGDRIMATVLRGEDKYLQCQAWDCQQYKPEGVAQYDDINTLLLEEVFVPLRLDSSALAAGYCGDEKVWAATEAINSEPNRPPDQIWDFLRRASQQPMLRQMVIVAWGGYGKTTLLRHIAYTYSTKKQGCYNVKPQIPVLLVLRRILQKYPDIFTKPDPPDLPTLITQYHIPTLPTDEELKLPPNWATDILRNGKALVMLDGFDEVSKADRPIVARWLTEQMRRYRQSIFILTSRPKAYKDQDLGDHLEMATQIWIHPFETKERKQFVEQWYWCQERAANGGRDTPDVKRDAQQAAKSLLAQIEALNQDGSPNNLTKLASNPLLLTMIATFHRRFPEAGLPRQRTELYQDICRLQLKDRPQSRKLETLSRECEAQVILQMLALEMMQKNDANNTGKVEQRVERDDLIQRLSVHLKAQNETVDAATFLQQVVEISELLVETEANEYDFAHLSFQEYLAAAEIARLQQEALLYDQFGNDQWKPVIVFYAGMVKNPSGLLRQMLAQGATELAYACLQETARQVDIAVTQELTALKQRVQASRYQQLETYLKTQQWQEADQETYRLMITAIGKEDGQWFDLADLKNFPCEDLQTLDQLWVKYSNGKWGFSVQKRIWEECGSPIDYSDKNEQSWEKFGNRVGWRKGKRWVTSNDFTYNLQKSMPGELPLLFGVGWWGEVVGMISYLAQRLVDCGTSQS